MKNITVYSTTTCPYCIMLTRWLTERGVAFTEHKVDQDPAAARKMIEMSHQMGVPFTTIEEEGSDMVKILGFDVPRLEKALKR